MGNRPTVIGWGMGLVLLCVLGFNLFIADNALLRIANKQPKGLLDIIWRGPEHTQAVALTFDDGPVPAYTVKILNILKKYKVHATFFVLGQYAEEHPAIIRRMILEGHEVENHTYDHPILTMISTQRMRDEIGRCHAVISRLTGRGARFFRPPYEIFDGRLILALKDYPSYDICLWSIALERRECKTARAMAERVVAGARNGEIILAHDGRIISDRRLTVAAIPLVIVGCRKKGLGFATLKEMFHLRASGDDERFEKVSR